MEQTLPHPSATQRPFNGLGKAVDWINSPPHYAQLTPQPIEVIEAWELDFHGANVLKYLARAPYKGDALNDLKKARFYLDRKIAMLEREEQ